MQTVKPLTTAAVSRKVAGNYIAFGEEVAGELDLTSRLAFRVQRGSRSW
ncbi:MAG: hypothetical protein HY660_18125 [Armatimonadetes bacterium]|nr:hypothetical protein [Armatimonadota bacterium]